VGKKIDKFNYWFDFIWRIKSLIITLIIIALTIVLWPYIDWRGTRDNLIAEHTPFKIIDPTATSDISSEVVKLAPNTDYVNIYQNGKIIFTVDKPYDISKKQFTIDKISIKGSPNYKQPFSYAGAKIRIVHINEIIGLLITGRGAEGPVLRGIDCVVE